MASVWAHSGVTLWSQQGFGADEEDTQVLCKFIEDDSGAVTVDWVVLTAAIVGLGFAVAGVIIAAMNDPTNALANTLETDQSGRMSQIITR